MELTADFKLEEFTNSETARRKGIDNSASGTVVQRLKNLCTDVLQPIRDRIGALVGHDDYYIKITSGYRCTALNKILGGSDSSFHKFGYAADCELWVKVNGEYQEMNALLFHAVKAFDKYTELIWEYGVAPPDCEVHEASPAWVHIAYSRKDERKMIKLIT